MLREDPAHPRATHPTVFVGRVLTPDGRPACNAVVVSSAGGQAVTGADGRFELAVDVPHAAACVDVTASVDVPGDRSDLVASARILPASLARTTSVGRLVLASASCRTRWLPTFGGEPGLGGNGIAFTTFDDGGGTALYATGDFTGACGVAANHIAKWDGRKWSALGTGLDDPAGALAVFDDGSGSALYAGGWFTTAGGVAAAQIARWDGATWSALGNGMNQSVHALAVIDDGNGPALYAGGWFTTAGGVAANHVAKWDGSS
jgi:hypothetical protein